MVSRTFQEHLLNRRKVSQRFREARLTLNPEKCQLFQKEVRYLGHVVSPEAISDPKKLKAVREYPTPKNKYEIRSFLCLYNYYRRFNSGFANVAKLLTKLTEKKQAFQSTPEVEAAFQTLKEAFCIAPIVAYPQPTERYVIDTDVRNVGTGGVLSQVQDGRNRVMAFYNKMLNKAEKNYCITQRELHAFVRTLENFSKYLYGQDFHPHTDHSALTWPMRFKNFEGQTACWIQRFQKYSFTSDHRQG
jgi:hypothetical protein